MISPIRIAVQGLQPGGVPLEIASHGLLVSITPPDENEEVGLYPVFLNPPLLRGRKVVVNVTGCTARLIATSENVAAGVPSTEELDADDDRAWLELIRRRKAEAAEDSEEEIEFQVWEHFFDLQQEAKRREEEARAFRSNVARITRGLRKGPRIDLVGISAAIVGFAEENHELRRRLEALEAEAAASKKTATKPAHKAPKK